MKIYEEAYVQRLMTWCLFYESHSACKTLSLYLSIGRIVERLEDELKVRIILDPPVRPPLGPDPAPETGRNTGRFAGDAEGDPARILPTKGLLSDMRMQDVEVEAAVQLQNALNKVVSALEQEIHDLKQGQSRTHVPTE